MQKQGKQSWIKDYKHVSEVIQVMTMLTWNDGLDSGKQLIYNVRWNLFKQNLQNKHTENSFDKQYANIVLNVHFELYYWK